MDTKVNIKRLAVFLACFMLGFFVSFQAIGQKAYEVKQTDIVFKEIDGHKLTMTVYSPIIKSKEKLPAIVFYFGGGWNIGTRKLFDLQAKYLASRGMVAVCPEYRVGSKHKTTVVECVKDARSAIRYIKSHADDLNINPDQIISSGASAGGHLAATLATIDNFNESTDDTSISVKPYAMVLFCPAVKIEHEKLNEGYRQRFAGLETQLSPFHNLKKNMPPTLVMSGTKDTQVKIEDMRAFKKKMDELGNQCKQVEYEGQGHGFAKYSVSPEFFKQALSDTEQFLDKLIKFKSPSWLDEYVASLPKK